MERSFVNDLPPERPRERLRRLGVEALRNEELLALVLRTGFRGQSALEVATAQLAAHTLGGLLRMPVDALARVKGMGPARAAAFLAAVELARRDVTDVHRPTLRTAGDVVAQSLEIRDKKKEYLLAFFLNARHQLLAKEVISIGTLTASLAHPREIFSPAIGKAAAGVILVHNHPSGDPSPSDEDIRLTKRIAQAGVIMGIELLDHLIVAENGCYSFKASGGL
jgi:DNA repair protein RadC